MPNTSKFPWVGDLGDPQTLPLPSSSPYEREPEAPAVVVVAHESHEDDHMYVGITRCSDEKFPESMRGSLVLPVQSSITGSDCLCATTLPCKLHNRPGLTPSIFGAITFNGTITISSRSFRQAEQLELFPNSR